MNDDEVVEKAARAMYADNEVGDWENGDLDTLLRYRRAARIALEAAPPYLAPAVPQPVDREALISVLMPYMKCSPQLVYAIASRVADRVLAVLAGGEHS